MNLEKVVYVDRETGALDPLLETVRTQLGARGVAWDSAAALPDRPAPGTLYLLHVGSVTRDEQRFAATFGEIAPAVAARTVLDEAARQRETCVVLDRWRFAGALESALRATVARLDIATEARPQWGHNALKRPDGRPSGYAYLLLREDQTQADVVVEYLLRLAEKVD